MKDTRSASNGPSAVTFETVNDVFSDFCNLTFTLVFEVSLVSRDVRLSDSFADPSSSARSVTADSGLSLFSPAVFATFAASSLASCLFSSRSKKSDT